MQFLANWPAQTFFVLDLLPDALQHLLHELYTSHPIWSSLALNLQLNELQPVRQEFIAKAFPSGWCFGTLRKQENEATFLLKSTKISNQTMSYVSGLLLSLKGPWGCLKFLTQLHPQILMWAMDFHIPHKKSCSAKKLNEGWMHVNMNLRLHLRIWVTAEALL